jgi:hypothetical protein
MLMLTTAKPRTFVRAIFIQMLSGRTVTVDFFFVFCSDMWKYHQYLTTCPWFPCPRGWVGIWSALLRRICCDGQAVAGQERVLHGLQCMFCVCTFHPMFQLKVQIFYWSHVCDATTRRCWSRQEPSWRGSLCWTMSSASKTCHHIACFASNQNTEFAGEQNWVDGSTV